MISYSLTARRAKCLIIFMCLVFPFAAASSGSPKQEASEPPIQEESCVFIWWTCLVKKLRAMICTNNEVATTTESSSDGEHILSPAQRVVDRAAALRTGALSKLRKLTRKMSDAEELLDGDRIKYVRLTSDPSARFSIDHTKRIVMAMGMKVDGPHLMFQNRGPIISCNISMKFRDTLVFNKGFDDSFEKTGWSIGHETPNAANGVEHSKVDAPAVCRAMEIVQDFLRNFSDLKATMKPGTFYYDRSNNQHYLVG